MTATGIKVTDIAYVRFEAPDLDVVEAFFTDFGLRRSARTDDTLYLRGLGDEGFVHITHRAEQPSFVGLGFAASSLAELEKLAAHDDFSPIAELDGPGGGAVVTATDPNGFRVDVVANRGSVGALPAKQPGVRNDAIEQPRTGAPLRLESGPSQVKRLGHCVIDVVDFRTSEAWYKQHLGLVTSDEIALDDDRSLGAFLRCDRGAAYVDHHTLFLVGLGRAKFGHAAFEVADFDDLMLGNTHLANAGHTHQWGIGRHILGSQIYDYWLDPNGHMVEHWTDGDLFNDETPPNTADFDTLLGSQWGPISGSPPS